VENSLKKSHASGVVRCAQLICKNAILLEQVEHEIIVPCGNKHPTTQIKLAYISVRSKKFLWPHSNN
jgi:hypothetical protein